MMTGAARLQLGLTDLSPAPLRPQCWLTRDQNGNRCKNLTEVFLAPDGLLVS